MYEKAFSLGLMATLAIVVVALVWTATSSRNPVEQRATRLGTLAGLVSAATVAGLELAIFFLIDRWIGAFLAPPCVLAGALSAWSIGRKVYRAAGGGQDVEDVPAISTVEQEVIERQGEIWCRLRDMAHFLETTHGNLINLVTGDCLTWTTYRGQKCIKFKLAGTTSLIGARQATLDKYLSAQVGIAHTLRGQA